jgi:hypothetical protein
MAETAAASEQLRRYVETHHIDRIPAGARHGKPWHQFAFWWGGNVNVFNVVLGAVVVSIGLAFWWALIAIAAGTMIGALLIALHATQGPKLGVPQTIQSRAQFGFYGSAFLFPAVLLINVGFIAAQFVIQAQAMRGVTGVVTIPQWILILTVPAVVIGVFGYRWIHRVMQATAIVVGASLVVMLAQGLRYGPLPAHELSLASPPAGLFLAGVALLVIDMLSFGPFVSDYRRLVRNLELADDVDQDLFRDINERRAELRSHRTSLERQLAAAEEQAHQTHNPVLLDHLPVAAIDLDGMADETTRRLFEALRLEIRYDPANLIARCSITLTGDTIDAVSRTSQEITAVAPPVPVTPATSSSRNGDGLCSAPSRIRTCAPGSGGRCSIP